MTAQSTAPALSVSRRTQIRKQLAQLRAEGLVPGVVYGHKKESISLSINQRDFRKLYEEAGNSTLINLKINDEKAVKVLVHEVQRTALRGDILHVDFYQVNLKEKLRTNVPLEFIGVSAAVEELDGTFIASKDEVEIECLPDALIQHIDVDISALATFADDIRISDLIVPEGVIIIDDAEEMVASVSEPISQAELDALNETPETEVKTEFGTEEGTIKEPVEEGK